MLKHLVVLVAVLAPALSAHGTEFIPADVFPVSVLITTQNEGASSSGSSSATLNAQIDWCSGTNGSLAMTVAVVGHVLVVDGSQTASVPSGQCWVEPRAEVWVEVEVPESASALLPVTISIENETFEHFGGAGRLRLNTRGFQDGQGNSLLESLRVLSSGVDLDASPRQELSELDSGLVLYPPQIGRVMSGDRVRFPVRIDWAVRMLSPGGTSTLHAEIPIRIGIANPLGDVSLDGALGLDDAVILRRVLAGEQVP